MLERTVDPWGKPLRCRSFTAVPYGSAAKEQSKGIPAQGALKPRTSLRREPLEGRKLVRWTGGLVRSLSDRDNNNNNNATIAVGYTTVTQ
jgi:hypothetical protein